MVKFKFSNEQKTFDAVKGKLTAKLKGNAQPRFAFSYDLQDASGDGMLSKDETAKLRVFVRNVGQADSDETIVYLKNMAFQAVYLKKGRTKIKSIKQGGQEIVEFEFDIKGAPKEGAKGIDLEVDVYDTTYRQLTQKKITIPYTDTPIKVSAASGQAKVSAKSVSLRSASSATSDVAATAKAGAILPVVGKIPGWMKVDLDGRLAWIESKSVDVSKTAGTLAGLQRDIMFQPPAVEITPAVMITSSDKVTLKGAAQDDAGVKDYYIFVYNRDDTKLNSRKLHYVRGEGGDRIKIDAKVPLFKGMNRIAIVARDQDGMSTTESTYVYRQ